MLEARGNSQLLAGFIARKTEIATILARLTALSSDQFGYDPEIVDWNDIGTVADENPSGPRRKVTLTAKSPAPMSQPHASSHRHANDPGRGGFKGYETYLVQELVLSVRAIR